MSGWSPDLASKYDIVVYNHKRSPNMASKYEKRSHIFGGGDVSMLSRQSVTRVQNDRLDMRLFETRAVLPALRDVLSET